MVRRFIKIAVVAAWGYVWTHGALMLNLLEEIWQAIVFVTLPVSMIPIIAVLWLKSKKPIGGPTETLTAPKIPASERPLRDDTTVIPFQIDRDIHVRVGSNLRGLCIYGTW